MESEACVEYCKRMAVQEPLQQYRHEESVVVQGVQPNTQPTNVGPGNDHVGRHNLNVAVSVELLAVLDGL